MSSVIIRSNSDLPNPEDYGKDIIICGHIKLKYSVLTDLQNDNCEYTEEITIYCGACDSNHKITVLVN